MPMPPPTPAPTPQPSALIQQAIRALEDRTSISARLRQTVNLFGKQLVGAGGYLEQRTGGVLRFRMDSRIQLGDQLSSFILLCDGQYLWKFQRLHDPGTLTRIDVTRVLQALEEAGQTERLGRAGDWAEIGGLPKLLRGLYTNFDFQAVEPTQLAGMVIENARATNQLPVWKLSGQWNRPPPGHRLPDQNPQIPVGQPFDLSQLPEPLPQYVDLYLGREDLFPYCVEYFRRRPTGEEGQGGAQRQSIVKIDLFGVNWNPVDPANFVYNPGNLDVKDQTEEFLRSLELDK
jgi:hypothetical protein